MKAAYLNAWLKNKIDSNTGIEFRRILEVKRNLADTFIRINRSNNHYKQDLIKDDKGRIFFVSICR